MALLALHRWFERKSIANKCSDRNLRHRVLSRRLQLESLEDRLAPATHTWTGAVSNLWSNNGNWTGGAPTTDSLADLVFPTGVANLTNINDITNLLINSITYTGSGYTTSGNQLAFTAVGVPGTITIGATVTGADAFNAAVVFSFYGMTVNVASNAATLTLGGTLSETAPTGLNINGTGTLLLSGNNTYSGGTTLSKGTLAVGSNTALGTGGLSLAGGTAIQAVGGAQILNNAVSVNGDVTVSGSNDLTSTGNTTLTVIGFASPLTVTVANTGLTTFGGSLSDNISFPPTSLIKAGPGTLVLSGNGTSHTSPTVINAGTLLVNGALSSSDVTVGGGATLGGSGTVRNITATGTVSPGGPGTAILRSGNGTFNTGSSFVVKLNGTTPGSGFDQLNALGGVDLTAGPTLSVMPGFQAAAGNTFTLISAANVKGTFNGLGNNAFLNGGGQVFQISYTLTSVVLSRTMSATTAAVVSSANPSVFGQPVTFTATITANNPGLGAPTGTVQFVIDGANFGSPMTLVNGAATSAATSSLAVGGHSIMAVYSGDANFITSTGTLAAQNVAKASTSASISSSVNPSVFGQPVPFTATINVTAPGVGTPTATVQFQIDGINAGSPVSVSTTGGVTTASFTASTLAVGTHTVTGVYSGDANFAATTASTLTETVKQASTVTTIASAVNPSISSLPVTFTAVVQAVPPGKGMPTGLVTFRDGRTVLGTAGLDSTATATLTTANLIGGKHSITAVYNSDTNFNSSTSPSIIQKVTVTPNQAFVIALYRTVLERLPDAQGFSFWVQQLNSGVSRSAVALAFEVSVENRAIEVDQFYAQIFHRPADVTGRTIWVNALVSGQSEAAVVVTFLTSPEYTAAHADNASYVSGLYQDLLMHAGDPGGSAYWLDLLRRGVETRSQVALSFLGAAEAFTQAIDFYYTNFLGRPADTLGRQSFLDSLQRAKLTSTALSTIFLASDEFLARAIMLAGG